MRRTLLLVSLTIWALTASAVACWLRRDGLETTAERNALAKRLDEACHLVQVQFDLLDSNFRSPRPDTGSARHLADTLVHLSQGCLPENLKGAPYADVVGLILMDATSKDQVDAAARHLAAWAGWYAQAFKQARKAGWRTHDWTAYFLSRGR